MEDRPITVKELINKLKKFEEQPNKNWSWYELSEMTAVCVSCGSENIKEGTNE